MSKRGETKYPSDWARKRVRRWNRIVGANPFTTQTGRGVATQVRHREFDERYEQLEGEVPTP